MTANETRTALIIEVPAAEPVVRRHRLELDPNARLGVPAHVTILAPFMPRRSVGRAELARLERIFARAKPFDFYLDQLGWFGTTVLWLGLQDPTPFRHLTSAVFAEFPDFPPFEGRFDDVVPHLTVGCDCPVDALRLAEQEIMPSLPVAARAPAVTLLAQSSVEGRWEAMATIPLGP